MRFATLSRHLEKLRPSAAMRAVLLAGLLATLGATAQAPGDVRVALVIGNAAYLGDAALINPVNDARAMADSLRGLGFTVIEAHNSGKAQMAQAIERVGASLKGKHGVGMFYYAGHGVQLDWHNYMIPIDATLRGARDVPVQTIDVNAVIDAFRSAGNRMNILVLDACRDNPFGRTGAASGKGLAQQDAPPGTFLAYSTAPGNVAEDGDAKSGNGLYTQYLLQELKRPQARIEDVFKRVRLNVRQQSQGRQIPWESTSLEDDFHFNTGTAPGQRPEDLERLAAEGRAKVQQLLQQAGEARDRERQIAVALEKEQRAQAEAAKAAEQQRLADQARAREAEQLAGEARAREQALLQAEIKSREAQRAADERQAKEREQVLAQQRAKEQETQKLLVAQQEAEAQRQQTLLQAAATPKKAQAQPAEPEKHNQDFAAQKEQWDKIKDSTNADDFYAYLREFPSGLISQQAMGRLEVLAKAAITSQADKNGFSQDEARFRSGDTYEFVSLRDFGPDRDRRSRRMTQVTSIVNGVVAFSDSTTLLTTHGSTLRSSDGATFDPPVPDLPVGEYRVGATWAAQSLNIEPDGRRYTLEATYKIIALEDITVPAGTFKAYRIERIFQRRHGASVHRSTYWVQPGWGLRLRNVHEQQYKSGAMERTVTELVSRKRGDG